MSNQTIVTIVYPFGNQVVLLTADDAQQNSLFTVAADREQGITDAQFEYCNLYGNAVNKIAISADDHSELEYSAHEVALMSLLGGFDDNNWLSTITVNAQFKTALSVVYSNKLDAFEASTFEPGTIGSPTNTMYTYSIQEMKIMYQLAEIANNNLDEYLAQVRQSQLDAGIPEADLKLSCLDPKLTNA